MPMIGQLNFPAALSPRKKHWHALIRRMDGPLNRSGHPGFEYPTVYYVAQSQFSLCSSGPHLPQVIQVSGVNFHWSYNDETRLYSFNLFYLQGKNISLQILTNKCTYITFTLKHIKLLLHISIFSDHHQGVTSFFAKVITHSRFSSFL